MSRRERTRFLIDLLSPELMESLRQAAERDGMGLGTWFKWLGTKRQEEQKMKDQADRYYAERMKMSPWRPLDPKTEVDLAERVSRGLQPVPEGARVLTREEYFSRPEGSCMHPQGWPCFTTCAQ